MTVISNYGGLPIGITVKDLRKEHNSILRNPDVAQMCFYRKYIEMIGSGTLRMIRDCKKEGFQPPVWKDSKNVLELTFPGVRHHREGINEGVNEGVKLNIEGVNEGVKQELNLLYSFIEANPNKKANELSKQMGKNISTIERYLKILKENDLVEFIGAPKTGGYRVQNKQKKK